VILEYRYLSIKGKWNPTCEGFEGLEITELKKIPGLYLKKDEIIS
jgi:hypothetical protein